MLIPRKAPPLLKEGRRILKSQREHDINVVLSAFRSFRSTSPVGYLSTPITTGLLFYEVLERYKVKTVEALLALDKDILFNEIIRPNTSSGIALGDELAIKYSIPIIVPAVLEAKSQRWTQDDYMYVWYQVIKEMVGHIFMRDGWQYSNGGVEEFVHSVEAQSHLLLTPRQTYDFPQYTPVDLFPDRFADQRIEFPETMRITDQLCQDIRVDTGARMIMEAIINLYQRGFKATKLLASLMQLVGMAHCVDWYVQAGQYKVFGLGYQSIDKKAIDKYWQRALAESQEDFNEIKALAAS